MPKLYEYFGLIILFGTTMKYASQFGIYMKEKSNNCPKNPHNRVDGREP